MESISSSPRPRLQQCPCSRGCEFPGFEVEELALLVPSNYKHPEGPQITIVASRITRKGRGQMISENIIILNGGPGTAGEQNRNLIEMIDPLFGDEGIAYFELDLCSTGRSTPFVSIPMWHTVRPERNKEIFDHLPFDYRDLTLENAAGDVAALAEAIQGPSWGRMALALGRLWPTRPWPYSPTLLITS